MLASLAAPCALDRFGAPPFSVPKATPSIESAEDVSDRGPTVEKPEWSPQGDSTEIATPFSKTTAFPACR